MKEQNEIARLEDPVPLHSILAAHLGYRAILPGQVWMRSLGAVGSHDFTPPFTTGETLNYEYHKVPY